MKNVNKKCTACKLTYLNKQDAKNHKQKDHMANYKGTKGKVAAVHFKLTKIKRVTTTRENMFELKFSSHHIQIQKKKRLFGFSQ